MIDDANSGGWTTGAEGRIDDRELLRRYADEHSEAAFAELVQRYLDLVYFAALRRVGGDAHAAADAAQRVFTALARQAAALAPGAVLPGWLYATTRNMAVDFVRAEQRRRAREQEAHTMHELTSTPPTAAVWEQMRPMLDEVMDELGDADRELVVLRFFARRPFADVGAALNLSEDAARMRVDRALDKLHALLAKRGVTSTSAALALLLANEATAAAPPGLAAAVTGAALAGATAAGPAILAAKVLGFMSTTKLMAGAAAVIAVAATAITWQQRQTSAGLRAEVAALRQQTATVAALRAENQRLVAEKASDAETARAEHEELVQLRAAREAFRQRQAALAARTQPGARGAGAPGPRANLAPGMVSMEAMQDSGNGTPGATAESIAAGLQHADFQRVAALMTFEPADRAKLEAFIATLPEDARTKYGTPEQVVALAMAGTPHPIAGVQLLSSTQPDPNTEVQVVQWQYQSGEVTQNELKFVRDADGWKQVVSAATVDRVIAYLKSR